MTIFSNFLSNKARFSFFKWPLRNHLMLAVLLALLMRVIIAQCAFGPQSLDDYNHGLVPALRWSQAVSSEIPDYRNHLIVWIVGSVFKVCDVLKIDDSLLRLKLAYFEISLFSILSLLGVWLLMTSIKSRTNKISVLYAVALNPIYAFVSTRLLGESVSIGFLVLGMGLIHWHKMKGQSWHVLASGLLFVGLAALFRFQVGIVYVCYLAYYLVTKQFKSVRLGLLVGIGLVCIQGGVDLLSGKYPLQTLIAYVNINKNGATEYGVTPWYSTWLLLAAFLYLPFSWSIFKKCWKPAKEYFYIIVFVLIFVGFHSMIPHKEERFLFPIFPLALFFVTLFSFFNRKEKWVRWNHWPYFLFLNTLFFFVGILSNSQESVVGPVARYTPSHSPELVVEIGPLFGNKGLREYFIHSNQTYLEFPDVRGFAQYLSVHPEAKDLRKLVMFPSPNLPEEQIAELKKNINGCLSVEKFQSASDAILYKLNPMGNERRVASWRVICG